MLQKNLSSSISLKNVLYSQRVLETAVGLHVSYQILSLRSLNIIVTFWQILNKPWVSLRLSLWAQQHALREVKVTIHKKKTKKKLKKKTRLTRLTRLLIKIKKTKPAFLSSLFYLRQFSEQKNLTTVRNLSQRILIKQQTINENFLQTYYKFNKINNYRTSANLFSTAKENKFIAHVKNYHNKPYWALRAARIAHWQLFTNKTLREQRYKGFLKIFLRKYSKLAKPYIFIINNLLSHKISWTKLKQVNSLFKNSLVQEHHKNIFQIPTFFSKFINWGFFKIKNKKIKKKIGKWSYLKFKKFSLPWLQKKKNFPKIIKHINPNLKYFKISSYYDPLTGYVYLNNLFKKENLNVLDISPVNFLVKLHTYRYNP